MTRYTVDASAYEEQVLDEIRQAMQSYDWQLDAVVTFTHGMGVQVYLRKPPPSRGRRKVGPILFPSEGQTLADLLATLGSMTQREEGSS